MTYCLCFSIIMLNTDLHNKNMRDDNRMSLEDYIKFNTNYGDMNKGRPLSKELLCHIYHSIQDDQLLIVDDVVIWRGVECSRKTRTSSLWESGRTLST